MTDVTVGNAAAQSTAGTVYQFYVAVEKCFELAAGQSVYIEKFGDVTVSGSCQIEVKHYGDTLTDGHDNFWKTLGNWLRPEFDAGKYPALILCTTQEISSSSRFRKWNESDAAARLAILREITAESEQRHAERVAKADKSKPPAVPESLQRQRQGLAAANLSVVIPRVFIASSSLELPQLHARLKERFCKGVLVGKQDDMCSALLGFILSPKVITEQGWAVSYEEFKARVETVHSQYCKETRVFPTKYRQPASGPVPAVPAKLFVQKIQEIGHLERVPQAIRDYLYASDTVAKDFAAYERPVESYDIFSEAVLGQFGPQQNISRSTLAHITDKEKVFYDQMMMLPVPSFPHFETPPHSFRNGVLQMYLDDEPRNLNWKLT